MRGALGSSGEQNARAESGVAGAGHTEREEHRSALGRGEQAAAARRLVRGKAASRRTRPVPAPGARLVSQPSPASLPGPRRPGSSSARHGDHRAVQVCANACALGARGGHASVSTRIPLRPTTLAPRACLGV